MSTTTLSKEDYLKRYLSGGADTKEGIKKKKKKKKDKDKPVAKVLPRVRIIDNDVAIPSAIEEAPITLSDDNYADNEDLPAIASVQDDRDIEIQIKEEFDKSGKWRTFTDGVDIARKNLINEVIKIEQSDLKDEPLSDEELSEFLKPKKKKKIKKERLDVEIKSEPKSPVRSTRRHDSDGDSPPSRRRHDSDGESPPRRRRHDSDGDSPPRRRHDSDNSPPRRRHDSDASPPRRRQESDSDASPPRRKSRINHDSDVSPPRKRTKQSDSDISPPRATKKDSDSDISPPRKGRNSDSDISPPRMKKTLDGKKAGLQNARDLKDELLMIRRKEQKMMAGLSDEVSGRKAETKVRGRLAEAEAKKAEEKARKEVPEEVKKKFETWNKGVTQVNAAAARLEDNLYEMSKPLTRGADDDDRETLLKERDREDDPMAAYMRKKKAKMEGRKKRLPQYQGPQPPPNRYGILPGYRWDGVDRSNGFEGRLMTQGASKKAQEEEAYKWSTEDM